MRRSGSPPKSSSTYFARRPTLGERAPDQLVGRRHRGLQPAEAERHVALERRAAQPRLDALGERLHLGELGHGGVRRGVAPRLSA